MACKQTHPTFALDGDFISIFQGCWLYNYFEKYVPEQNLGLFTTVQ